MADKVEKEDKDLGEALRKSPYALRMPDDLRERIQLSAGMSHRSLNAEICALLEQGLLPAALSQFSDEAILGECRKRFPGTKVTVAIELTQDQLDAITSKQRAGGHNEIPDDLAAAGQ